ncbi:MAG: TIGR00296 family protein [Thermoproteus sp.]|nr:TIGR00296 family protein [Thermoproteus sp.]
MAFRPYTLEEGAFLVKLARRAVEEFLASRRIIEPPPDAPARLLSDNYGVFTTIEKLTTGDKLELRGCIGYPEGYKNVATAIIYSAVAACCEDPRFPTMTPDELDEVVFEVSILSPLQLLQAKPKDLARLVEVGRHGIVVRRGFYSGLLLPQVPVDECWDSEEFLSNGCLKAWLHADCWLDDRTKVYVYEAQLFKEKSPKGEIYERDLKEELARCRERRAGGRAP